MGAMLAAISAAAASWGWSATSEDGVPQYERRAAPQAACAAAAAAIFKQHPQSGMSLGDDCRRSSVTPVSGKPSLVIVNRVVDVQVGQVTARRRYSVLLDGSRPEAWQAIRIEPAPNALSMVFAPLAAGVAATVADRPEPGQNIDRAAGSY